MIGSGLLHTAGGNGGVTVQVAITLPSVPTALPVHVPPALHVNKDWDGDSVYPGPQLSVATEFSG